MRKGKRKGKRDLDGARWLVHNISRSLGPPSANSFFFFHMLALSVPFTVTDEPPNRLFFAFGDGYCTDSDAFASPSAVLD